MKGDHTPTSQVLYSLIAKIVKKFPKLKKDYFSNTISLTILVYVNIQNTGGLQLLNISNLNIFTAYIISIEKILLTDFNEA
jgi:hypothetical protein